MAGPERGVSRARLLVAGALLAVGTAVTLTGDRAPALPAGWRLALGLAVVAVYAAFATSMLRAQARLRRSGGGSLAP